MDRRYCFLLCRQNLLLLLNLVDSYDAVFLHALQMPASTKQTRSGRWQTVHSIAPSANLVQYGLSETNSHSLKQYLHLFRLRRALSEFKCFRFGVVLLIPHSINFVDSVLTGAKIREMMWPTSCGETSMILVAPTADDCCWRFALQTLQRPLSFIKCLSIDQWQKLHMKQLVLGPVSLSSSSQNESFRFGAIALISRNMILTKFEQSWNKF